MFAVVPRQRKFNLRKDSQALKKLERTLSLHDKVTEKIKITDAADVLLDNNGRLQGRFQLTTTALSQLCSRAVPYLSQVIYNVSGLRNRADLEDQQTCDVELAIGWVNDALRLRFDMLRDCTLVVDRKQKRVEGVVGRKYAFLSNLELYNQAKDFVKDEPGGGAEFREAVIAGRRMFMRFAGRSPLFSLGTPSGREEPFYGGYHFANSEVGECSVRACSVLIRQWCDNKAISPFCEGGKLPHYKGPQFRDRFQELLDRVRVKAEEAANLKPKLSKLRDVKLGLGGNKESHDKRFDKLKAKLARKGVPNKLASNTVRRAMIYGSYRSESVVKGESAMESYASRNAYDLYNALTHECKRYSPGEREKAEQLAYQILLGKFNWS